MMKKVARIMASVMIATMLFTGCGNGQSAPAAQEQETGKVNEEDAAVIDGLKTMGDILDLESGETQCAAYDNYYVYVFELNGRYYRAMADMTKEQSALIWEMDEADEKYTEKYHECLDSLKIKSIENLSDKMLTQEELDKLVGKTCRELVDEGWTVSWSNWEEMEFWMNKWPFMYIVKVEGPAPEDENDSLAYEEALKNIKVVSAEFLSLGNACDNEIE